MSWQHLEDQYYSEPEYDEVSQECEWCGKEQDGWRLNADEWDCLTCRTVQVLARCDGGIFYTQKEGERGRNHST